MASPAQPYFCTLFRLLLAVLAIVLGCGPAYGATPPVRILLTGGADGVHIRYELPAEMEKFSIRLPAEQSPAADIRIEEDGFTLRHGEISASGKFSRFTLIVAPDHNDVDSVYPLMLPLGAEAAVICAPYLLPTSGPAEFHVTGTAGETRRVSEAEADGYLVLGGQTEDHGRFRSVIPAGTPARLRATMIDRTRRLLDFYARQLELRPRQRPTILLSYAPREQGAGRPFRGDVTSNGVVFLRIHGDPADATDPVQVAGYTAFLAHELFHLWNDSSDPDPSHWWLHEGGAEYASWLATAALWPSESQSQRRTESALRTCSLDLGGRPLSRLSGPESRTVRYPCGAVAQWIADIGARAAHPGSDIFTIWRRLFRSKDQDGVYRPRDFIAALKAEAPRAVPAIAAMLDQPGVDRWTAIASALNGMGARIEIGSPSPFVRRLAAVRPIVLSACSELWGVGETADTLYVQAPKSCAAFGDSPVVETAIGISPMDDPSGFYDAVSAACLRGVEIELQVNAKGARRTETVKCSVPVVPPPPDLKLRRWLPLAG